MVDTDGNTYTEIVIGNQIWTAENLRTTKFNDETDIPHVTDDNTWGKLRTPAYCFNENTKNAPEQRKWGALYNWHAVNTGKLAPEGWRVPTNDDWGELENYLIENGYNWDGSTKNNKIAKSLATKTDWNHYNDKGVIGNDFSSNNKTGFSALPGGSRRSNGYFETQGNNGLWWSATEYNASYAYNYSLNHIYGDLYMETDLKKDGFSIRLVKNLVD